MKCNLFSLLFLTLLIISSVSALEINRTYSTSSTIQVTSLKYEPSPVNPGDYFDIWISVKFLKNPDSNVQFELLQTYPFSVDPNQSATKTYSTPVSSSILLNYKVRVDKNAVEDTNTLTLAYLFGGTYYTADFPIQIEDAQTNFDAVIQDATSSEVSIAIANTGKNTANSVIVKIPSQDNFVATGTDGQMVGNLDSGDYSIVSFELSKKMSQQIPSTTKNTKTGTQGMSSSQAENLSFDIYYTDNIGVRRTVNMQLPVTISNTNMSAIGGFGGMRGRTSYALWYVLLVIVIVLIIVFFILYKKFPEKTKNFLKKLNPKNWKKKETVKNEIPDWIKKTKDKEKNK
jgi:hypothetical protein